MGGYARAALLAAVSTALALAAARAAQFGRAGHARRLGSAESDTAAILRMNCPGCGTDIGAKYGSAVVRDAYSPTVAQAALDYFASRPRQRKTADRGPRFLFLAGVEGTGHHFWRMVLTARGRRARNVPLSPST